MARLTIFQTRMNGEPVGLPVAIEEDPKLFEDTVKKFCHKNPVVEGRKARMAVVLIENGILGASFQRLPSGEFFAYYNTTRKVTIREMITEILGDEVVEAAA